VPLLWGAWGEMAGVSMGLMMELREMVVTIFEILAGTGGVKGILTAEQSFNVA
jgi:hypothetical protein